MSDTPDITALARLARIALSAEEEKKLAKEIPSILGFIEEIQRAPLGEVSSQTPSMPALREDVPERAGGEYTETLLNASVSREGAHIAVKQVVSRTRS